MSGDIRANIVVEGAEEGARKVEHLNKSIENTGKVSKLGIASMVGLAASASSLYFQINNLDQAQLRVTKSQRLMEEQQAKVNKLQREGQQNTEQYRFELRQLQEMQERLNIAQNNLSQSYVGIAFNIAGVALQIPVAITAMHGLTAAIHLNKLAWLAHPIGIILIAATTAALAIYASNVGGIKDKIDAWTGSLIKSAGAIKSSEGFHNEIDRGTGVITEYGTAVSKTSGFLREFFENSALSSNELTSWIERAAAVNNLQADMIKKNDEIVKQIKRDDIILDEQEKKLGITPFFGKSGIFSKTNLPFAFSKETFTMGGKTFRSRIPIGSKSKVSGLSVKIGSRPGTARGRSGGHTGANRRDQPLIWEREAQARAEYDAAIVAERIENERIRLEIYHQSEEYRDLINIQEHNRRLLSMSTGTVN